ncbi:MAG: rhomboid family intramembrane serine protease [Henriciella sp.]|nr:rhomboid family intramembrane serine protease [Henriciella sp.]
MQVYNDPTDLPEKPPIFRKGFPTVILVLTGAIVAVSLIQFNVSPELEDWMFSVGAIAGGPGFENVFRPWGDFAPYVLHTFLHGGSFHLLLNMAMLIAIGPIIAQALGKSLYASLLFLAFFAVCAIGGGLAQMLWYAIEAQDGIAIGASSAISGLLPAVGYIRDGYKGAWSMSVPWILINIVLAFLGGDIGIMSIAWAAHLGGLVAGFSFPVFLSLSKAGR